MLGRIKNEYEPETDGRTYRLSYQENDDIFINFDERELVEIAEILATRRKKLALKLVALLDQVAAEYKAENKLLEAIKDQKCLGRR